MTAPGAPDSGDGWQPRGRDHLNGFAEFLLFVLDLLAADVIPLPQFADFSLGALDCAACGAQQFAERRCDPRGGADE